MKTTKKLAAVIALSLAITACSSKTPAETASSTTTKGSGSGDTQLATQIAALKTPIVGGGASFPDAFYQAVNADFNKIAGSEIVTYAKSGSADGRAQLGAGTVNFAGSDSLPKPGEKLPTDLLFFPTVTAPITVSFNLGGFKTISLSPKTLAGIFQAQITRWDASEIAADNPDLKLPNKAINVVRRSDGSGTTKNFTSYLNSAVPEVWKLGAADEISWPASTQGAEKNSGVAEVIKKTDGAIGYVDLGDAAKAGLTVASVKNANGEFVAPTAKAVTAALSNIEIAENLTFSPLNSKAPGAYPITAPTWILISATQGDKASTMKAYLNYILGPGQKQASQLGFAPLPGDLASKAIAQIDKIS